MMKRVRIFWANFLTKYDPRTRKAYIEFWSAPSWKEQIYVEQQQLEQYLEKEVVA